MATGAGRTVLLGLALLALLAGCDEKKKDPPKQGNDSVGPLTMSGR